MNPVPHQNVPQGESMLEDPWFAEAPVSQPAPESVDPELDGEWFAKGRPLSSRPPPPVTED
jgi:hypothetical protein